ncbi:FxsB family cyclophane-forming radical SAM/SPASM peptide maturase [Streptomyces sp. NBC_01190]|uniref:FxsB family cyclophane-forming radical SAM/SPASM peptide maturase n=1 Tax=Streptomyces sp. NBC_01190 TaxID=2903767 RepID=UPI00386D8B76
MPRSVRPPPDVAADPPVHPSPVRQFILKVHSRCNLACSYCYIYAGPDSGWRDRPRVPTTEVIRRTAARIAEHTVTHRLREVAVVLHGGEPLLAGADRLAADIALIRGLVPATVHASVQTNATLLSRERIRRLRDAGLRIGVSLDGGLPAHNTARTDHAGRPAWPAAAAGIWLLAEEAPEAYGGILCVVDVRHDPVEVYESLLGFRPPMIDLLLPHGNWSAPPPGLPAPAADPAPYGRWLTAVFDRWWDADRRRTRIRLFEECVSLLLGVPAAIERLGLHPFTSIVVEADGAIEQVDSLKSAYEGAAATGLDVFRHSFDDALAHPAVAARQSGLAGLAATCRACPLVTVCGGGHYVHRYRSPDGFGHPSVYCADLAHLIRHIAARLTAAAPPGSSGSPGTSGNAPSAAGVSRAGPVPDGVDAYGHPGRLR